MRCRFDTVLGIATTLLISSACQEDESTSSTNDECFLSGFASCGGFSGAASGGGAGAGAVGLGGAAGLGGSSGASGTGAGGIPSSGGAGGTAGSIGQGGSGGAIAPGGTGGAVTGAGGIVGTGGAPGTCDAGTATTAWAQGCATSTAACTPGNFVAPGSTTNDPLGYESEHFAFYWPSSSNFLSNAQEAATYLESIWTTFTGSPILFQEPYCNTANKRKVSVVIRSGNGLTGGGWGSGNIGMWIGPGATSDHWGLAHEFTHALQASSGGLASSSFVGWMWESHANWHAHQLPEFHDNAVHCSELLVNFPHLYLGSTRDRYCNWQFMEYLKDKYCYAAVEDIWSKAPKSGTAQRTADPFTVLRTNMGWGMSELNDFFGEWAMHNVTWDYRNPDGTDQGPVYRNAYGATGDRAGNARGAPAGFRRLRTTSLDALDLPNRRFATPPEWAPQRWGYNVLRLHPDAGATSVTVTFRGVVQTSPANTNFGGYDNQPASIPNPNSDWRWGLVAVDASGRARYSSLQRGSDGELVSCVQAGDTELWLVVMATPTENQQIMWDQMYYSIYRYPWMIQVGGAMPEGFQPNAPNPSSSGQRWPNGGGWVSSSANVASSVYVGPSASVLGGTLSGNARIDGHAVVVSGTISGNALIDALSVVSGGLTVSDSAHVGTVFQGPGTFEQRQVVSSSAQILGDVELRGTGINLSSGVFYGFIDTNVAGDPQQGANRTAPVPEVTAPGPYTWRP